MEYLPVQYFSDKWEISKRRIQILCKEGRINGAKMIGNMWVIPADTERPADARSKNPVIVTDHEHSSVRRELKKLIKKIFKTISDIGVETDEQKNYVLTGIAGGLSSFYFGEKDYKREIYGTVYRDITGNTMDFDINDRIVSHVNHFIDAYKADSEVDNILSWAYQYSNKIIRENIYSKTQFFTEKYMIEYLIHNIEQINMAGKIVDPCVGGGNFLVECLEHLCNEEKEGSSLEQILLKVNRLYGYDIDSGITKIAVVNIRLRVLAILKRNSCQFDFSIWNKIQPNIFKSLDDDVGGSLCAGKKKVVNVLDNQTAELSEALGNADIILTNPPFATIKGMSAEEKDFLKKYYPDANCDTCVSFLEAIYSLLAGHGVCGIVSQNAWMHLKSFRTIRKKITSQYTIYKIVNLGAGAFVDLSGEKSNVSLLIFGRKINQENTIQVLNLENFSLKDKISLMCGKPDYLRLLQNDIDGPNGYDFTEKGSLKAISSSIEKYKDIGTPMQGTSTGNAKELVGYFWEHFGEEEWVSVSNGGGYCRWQGLNHSVVKWGREGEYIKAQKGSALRNVKYFPETQLVFSDTGTAGLNVRRLLDHQIFIASGPGIRVTKGNEYAHLALLNSRIAAYYLKIMSPKLTIAAGYIGQIPVNEGLYTSVVLEKNAKLCVELKEKILSTRPENLEYDPAFLNSMPSDLEKAAWSLFNDDITNELLKLEIESKNDRVIFEGYGFSDDDRRHLEILVGKCAYQIDGAQDIDLSKLDRYMDKIIDAACLLKRTRTSKNTLGSDGVIEYVSKDLNVNPEIIVRKIQSNPGGMKLVMRKYRDLVLHGLVLQYLGYNTRNGIAVEREKVSGLETFLNIRLGRNNYYEWLSSSFNSVHREIFKGVPYLIYEEGIIHRYDNKIAR